jgi:hypothetical protein
MAREPRLRLLTPSSSRAIVAETRAAALGAWEC